MYANLRKKARFLAPYIRGNAIIDLGSEDGNGDNYLHRALERYSGKNILSADYLGKPDIQFDFNKTFPLKKDSFDTIIISEVIEHVDFPLEFLRQCKKALKPGGRILLTTPNAVGLAEMESLYKRGSRIDYVDHIYNWSKRNMVFLVEYAGLKIVDFRYISFYWRKNLLFRSIAYMLPFLRPALFFVLTKDKESKS